MEIRLNKFGCFIFVLGMACIVRQTCQEVKKLNKEMSKIRSRVSFVERATDALGKSFKTYSKCTDVHDDGCEAGLDDDYLD